MDLLHRFKKTLIENGSSSSKVTVKNYTADVNKFISWYESTFNRKFAPSALPAEVLDKYLTPLKERSPRSAQRYISSLRKFFAFLVTENIITYNPLAIKTEIKRPEDLWSLREFDNYLYNSKSSAITRKNYLNDVNQFVNWVEAVTVADSSTISNQAEAFAKINTYLIEQYRNRLLDEAGLSPLSINRKLSSLRKYLNFAKSKGLLTNQAEVATSLATISSAVEIADQVNSDPSLNNTVASLDDLRTLQKASTPMINELEKEYSSHAPVRLFQKTHKGLDFLFDSLVILSIVKGIEAAKYNLWKATGKQVFAPLPEVIKSLGQTGEIATGAAEAITRQAAPIKPYRPLGVLDRFITMGNKATIGRIRGIPKSVYAPVQVSTRSLPFWGKIKHNLRHNRPEWYKKYHRLSFVHYIHLAVILIFSTFLGLRVYQAYTSPQSKVAVLGSKISPNRLIAFQGALRDASDTPITKESLLRFAIYKSPTASGSALLWQEVQRVNPDAEGKFSTSLGKISALAQDIFVDNPNLYLGISIGTGPELHPRQELASAALAKNAQELQGLKPITGNNAQTENVILALDSSGNLTIGGTGSPIFQATGGEFRLSGQQLSLATNEGSNTNIVLSPDGTGIIDVQKPLQNTSENNNLSTALGAVEIDDNLAILASSSEQSALIINQNGTGELISASTGGTAKFTISNSGSVTLAEDLNILGNNFTTSTGTFSLANTNTLNLNIGGAATSISLGAPTGITTINNNLNVSGGITTKGDLSVTGLITASGGITLPGFTPGSIPFIGDNNQLAADSTGLFWNAANKRLGVGTQSPTLKLDIQDSQLSGGVVQIANTAIGGNTVGLNLKLGTTTAPQATNRWINFMDGNGAILGKIRGNNSSNTITFDSNGGDFAEYFPKANQSEAIEPGDMICYAKSGGVEKCQSSSNGIVGIFSDNAGFVGAGGHENDPNYVLVGLIGQLKIKISETSNPIKPGDPISFGTVSGSGAKATKAGQIVGRALEPYDSASRGTKTIKISLNISWYDPSAVLMDDGGLATAFETNVSEENELIKAFDIFGTPDTFDTFKNFFDTLEKGVLEVQRISTNSLSVATEDITIGTQTLREYIAAIVNEILDKRLAEEDKKTIVVVSPLAEVEASQSAQPDPTTTPQSSPTPSPSLTPSPAASQSATYITNIYNNVSTPSATPTITIVPSPTPSPSPSPSAETHTTPIPTPAPFTTTPTKVSDDDSAQTTSNVSEEILNTKYLIHDTDHAEIASFSAELSYVPNLKSEFAAATFDVATFNQGLIALGPTSLADTSISTQLSIGANMKLSEGSINTIGTDLALQPLRQGNLSIMGGLVAVDTQGNLTVEGNATFAKDVSVRGKFAANIIAPVPGQDLIMELSDKDARSKIQVKNASGSAVLSVNQLGDIISSGSAQFGNFKIVRGAQADTSFTETVASGSAGTAVITTNETERTIVSPFVTEDSLIYITPVSDTKGVTPYIARQTVQNPAIGSRGSFTIQIPQSQSQDIKLNWWIIN